MGGGYFVYYGDNYEGDDNDYYESDDQGDGDDD